MVVRVVEGIAEQDLLGHAPRELLDVLVAHGAVDEDALAGGAALPGAQVARGERRLDRGVDVGVVHDDDRAVAAHLQQRDLARRRLGDEAPGRRRADEGDGVHAGVARDLVAHDGPGAGHEVEHAGRHVGFGDAAGQGDGADGGRRRGRPHHRVAARQRGRDQLGGHGVGPVPRADDADDAERPAHEHHPLAGRERVGQLAAQALGVLGRHPPVVDELLDLAVGLGGQRLALVERERAGELVAARLDGVADRVHARRAIERGEARPGVGGPPGGLDGRARVIAIALRHGADDLAGRGAGRLVGLARSAGSPRPVHEHLLAGGCERLRRGHAPSWGVLNQRRHASRWRLDADRRLIYKLPI